MGKLRRIARRATQHGRDTAEELRRRAQKISGPGRARAGFFAGVAMSALGVMGQFGWTWAAMAGGVVVSVYFITLYDVDAGGAGRG